MNRFLTPARPPSPRLIGSLLLWGVMETAALRRSRQQRHQSAIAAPLDTGLSAR